MEECPSTKTFAYDVVPPAAEPSGFPSCFPGAMCCPCAWVKDEEVVGSCGEVGRNVVVVGDLDLYKLGGEFPEGTGRISGVVEVLVPVAPLIGEGDCWIARFPDCR